MFEIGLAGRSASIEALFPGFGEHDRLGLVMRRPCAAVGASALIAATITAFYDVQRSRGSDFFIYPDYYLFHVGGPLGDHARLDIWPRRKEVLVEDDPQRILEAIDDRAITRLAVEDGPARERELDAESVASARARIASCLAYSAAGRVAGADVRIESNPVAEGYVEAILDPEARMQRLRAEGAMRRSVRKRSRCVPEKSHPTSAGRSGWRGTTSWRTVCRWRPTGASSSTRRLRSSVDRPSRR